MCACQRAQVYVRACMSECVRARARARVCVCCVCVCVCVCVFCARVCVGADV